MDVTISLPEEVANVFLANGGDIQREVLEATSLEGYRADKLSRAQVGKMLGLTRFEVDSFLKLHGVPLNYSIEDLEADRRTLDALALK